MLEVTLPVFLDILPYDKDEMKIDNIHGMNLKKANYVKTLDALSELAIEPILFEAYVPQILNKLDFACKLSYFTIFIYKLIDKF